MSQKLLRYLFYGAVLLGLADSLYLSMTVLLGIAPTCGLLQGCEIVSQSPYSRYFFGIHDAYLSVVYFFGAALLGGYIEGSRFWQKITVVYAGFGLVVALWSVFIMKFIIKAYCIYCLGIDAMLLALFILSIFILRKSDRAVLHTPEVQAQ